MGDCCRDCEKLQNVDSLNLFTQEFILIICSVKRVHTGKCIRIHTGKEFILVYNWGNMRNLYSSHWDE
jgi:hypothetical protein